MDSNHELWNRVYNAATSILRPRVISDHVEAGGVAAAILSADGNIYTGVCLDTACSLGFCAERNAIGALLTGGEQEIVRLVCIGSDERLMLPCGACRELMMQLGGQNPKLEILTDLKNDSVRTLESLLPAWWD